MKKNNNFLNFKTPTAFAMLTKSWNKLFRSDTEGLSNRKFQIEPFDWNQTVEYEKYYSQLQSCPQWNCPINEIEWSNASYLIFFEDVLHEHYKRKWSPFIPDNKRAIRILERRNLVKTNSTFACDKIESNLIWSVVDRGAVILTSNHGLFSIFIILLVLKH